MSLSDLYSPLPKPWCNINANTVSSTSGMNQTLTNPNVSSFAVVNLAEGFYQSFLIKKSALPGGATEFFNLQLPNANCSLLVSFEGIGGVTDPSSSVGTGTEVFSRLNAVSRRVGVVALNTITASGTQNTASSGSGLTAPTLIGTVSGGATAVNVVSYTIASTLAGGATAYECLIKVNILVQNAEGTSADLV